MGVEKELLFWKRRERDPGSPLPDPGTGPAVVLGAQPDPGRRAASRTSSPSDSQFRMSILERLEQMEKRMADMAAAGQAPCRGPAAPPIQVPARGGSSGVFLEKMAPACGSPVPSLLLPDVTPLPLLFHRGAGVAILGALLARQALDYF